MFKISLILLFSILIFPSIYRSISTITYKYKCVNDIKLDTCYLRTEVENGENTEVTYYVKGCPKNNNCTSIRTDGGQVLYECMKVKEYRKEGDSCVFNEECQSNNCVNKKCAYIADGLKCEHNQLCQKGSNGLEKKEMKEFVLVYQVMVKDVPILLIVLLDYYAIKQCFLQYVLKCFH